MPPPRILDRGFLEEVLLRDHLGAGFNLGASLLKDGLNLGSDEVSANAGVGDEANVGGIAHDEPKLITLLELEGLDDLIGQRDLTLTGDAQREFGFGGLGHGGSCRKFRQSDFTSFRPDAQSQQDGESDGKEEGSAASGDSPKRAPVALNGWDVDFVAVGIFGVLEVGDDGALALNREPLRLLEERLEREQDRREEGNAVAGDAEGFVVACDAGVNPFGHGSSLFVRDEAQYSSGDEAGCERAHRAGLTLDQGRQGWGTQFLSGFGFLASRADAQPHER